MVWSRRRFQDEARFLCRCLSIITNSNTDEIVDNSTTFELMKWEIVDTDDEAIYLRHQAITTVHPSQQPHESDNLKELSDPDPLVDETVLMDSEHCVNFVNDQIHGTVSVTWAFSIAYSDTFQVPVLYFHVHHQDGSPCIRSHVVRWLCPETEDSIDKTVDNFQMDSWEFISQEQHPHTCFPSYFLHPCRTSERIRLLQQTSSFSDDGERINLLWVWMSMILPAVNHPIPSKVHAFVQERLRQRYIES